MCWPGHFGRSLIWDPPPQSDSYSGVGDVLGFLLVAHTIEGIVATKVEATEILEMLSNQGGLCGVQMPIMSGLCSYREQIGRALQRVGIL